MPNLNDARNDAKLEMLKSILLQIMVNTGAMANRSTDEGPDSTESAANALIIAYLPMLYGALGDIAIGNIRLSNLIAKKRPNDEIVYNADIIEECSLDIAETNLEIARAMDFLIGNFLDYQAEQETYMSNLLANAEDFVADDEKDKNGNIFTKLVGGVSGAISGLFSRLFAPRPTTVVIAKNSIKDLAGIVKAATGKDGKESLKDRAKKKIGDAAGESIGNIIKKIGNAIANGIKGVSTALQVFIYVLFPLVILGAVAILVVGLFFIAKMIIEAFADVIVELIHTVIDIIEPIGAAIVGVVETIASVISAIADLFLKIIGVVGMIVDTIGKGVEFVMDILGSIGGLIKLIVDKVTSFLTSPSKIVSAAVNASKNILFGNKEQDNVDGNSDENRTDEPDFSAITNPICQSINDFAAMVKGYLSNIRVNNSYQTVRTNLAGASNINKFENNANTNSNRSDVSSYSTVDNNSNTQNNKSIATDGGPDRTFNKSTMNAYDYSYSSNPFASQINGNGDNKEVVKLLKEQNSLINRLLDTLTSNNEKQYSIIGD